MVKWEGWLHKKKKQKQNKKIITRRIRDFKLEPL